jgi:hypothetical protein
MLGLSAVDRLAVEFIYRHVWFINQKLLNRAQALIGALESNGIEVICLKGLPLLLEAYADEGGRFMSDLDLLVAPEQIDQTVIVLGQLGWKPKSPEYFLHRAYQLRHSEEFVHPSGLECDLHWRLFRNSYSAVGFGDLQVTRRSLNLRGQRVWVPSVEYQLLQLMIHGMSWELVPPIRWILDVHLLLKRHAVDWDMVIRRSKECKAILPVGEALRIYDEVLPGEIPAGILRICTGDQVSRAQRSVYRDMTRPYSRATLGGIWRAYRADRRLAVGLGISRPGVGGALHHFCSYLGAESPAQALLLLLKKLLNLIDKWRPTVSRQCYRGNVVKE